MSCYVTFTLHACGKHRSGSIFVADVATLNHRQTHTPRYIHAHFCFVIFAVQ